MIEKIKKLKNLKNYKAKAIIYMIIDKIFLFNNIVNYREALFNDLQIYCNHHKKFDNILEIGPKDGEDSRRLLKMLEPKRLCLIDLPDKQESNKVWLKELNSKKIEFITGNFMYDDFYENEEFDLIWCTGVLYHNPEQLRMLRRIFAILKPNGILVVESATTKERSLRNKNVVQINYPPSDAYKKKYHISHNITHLPSKKAIFSWLSIIGFDRIIKSDCHRKQSIFLARDRAAFICRRPIKKSPKDGTYYSHTETSYVVGDSL